MPQEVFPFLYGITDSSLMPGDAFALKIEAALSAGLKLLQYRNKTADKKTQLLEARLASMLCRKFGATFIVNDDVELALEAQAHGVHLGQQDETIQSARTKLGPQAMIGATCHSDLDLAAQAIKDGASYIAFGSFFSSQTKADALPADLNILQEAKKCFAVPVVAIGGINVSNANTIWRAGADCVAVCHAIFAAEDPGSTITLFTNSYRENT